MTAHRSTSTRAYFTAARTRVRRRVRVASTTPARAALPHPTVGSAHPPLVPPPGHDTCPRPASDDRIPIDGYRCGFVQPVFCLPSRRWSVGLTPAPSRRSATQKTLCVCDTVLWGTPALSRSSRLSAAAVGGERLASTEHSVSLEDRSDRLTSALCRWRMHSLRWSGCLHARHTPPKTYRANTQTTGCSLRRRSISTRRLSRECPTGSRKSAAMVNTSYPTFCISAMLSSSRSRCAFSIQRCS